MNLFSIFKKDKNKKGFSLVEMMVVLAVAGVLLIVTSLMFTTYRKNTRLNEAASLVMSDIKLAKQKAIAENRSYQLAFDSSDDTVYYVGPIVGGNLDTTNANYKRSLHKLVGTEISFRRVTSSEADNSIIIQSRGVTSNGEMVLQNGSKFVKVTVYPTGRIAIVRNVSG